MEMQWKVTPCRYLHTALREVQNQEQTLELRLTEGMPDIGRVLCAWGQPQLREKQWRTEEIGLSGGIAAWVLYIPEDGSQPRCVEGWIPFQGKWRLPRDCREGFIRADVRLRSIDARALSSRKILVRASFALLGEALEPREVSVSQPEQVPEHIQLLQKTYPVNMVKEAGEKLFTLEDQLTLPIQQGKLLSCRMACQVTEQAVTGSRVVLRGVLRPTYVYAGEDGRLYSGTQEIPFAQFGELTGEYDKEATAEVSMVFADGTCSLEADTLRIKCDLIAQYTIRDRCLLQIAEDAYSHCRTLQSESAALELPVLLDHSRQNMEGTLEAEIAAEQVVDVDFLPDHPIHYRQDGDQIVEIPGMFQTLYYDEDGQLQTIHHSWAGHWKLPAEENCQFAMTAEQISQPTAMLLGERIRFQTELAMDVYTTAMQEMVMLTELRQGESVEVDPRRPSLILRRAESLSLWELAKNCGSTVEAIVKANGLAGEPDPQLLLLIPVL